jgi:hypothetical protein
MHTWAYITPYQRWTCPLHLSYPFSPHPAASPPLPLHSHEPERLVHLLHVHVRPPFLQGGPQVGALVDEALVEDLRVDGWVGRGKGVTTAGLQSQLETTAVQSGTLASGYMAEHHPWCMEPLADLHSLLSELSTN